MKANIKFNELVNQKVYSLEEMMNEEGVYTTSERESKCRIVTVRFGNIRTTIFFSKDEIQAFDSVVWREDKFIKTGEKISVSFE